MSRNPTVTHQMGSAPIKNYETLPSLDALGIPAVAPLPTGETADTTRLVERFGENIIAAGLHNGNQVVYVQPDQLVDLSALYS